MMSPSSITVELPEVGPTGAVRVVAYSGRRLDEHLKGLYQESRRLKGEHLAACVALGHALSVVRATFRRGAWEQYVSGLGINLKSAQRAIDLNAKSGDGNGGLSPKRIQAIERLREENAEQGPEGRHTCRLSGGRSDSAPGVGDAGGLTVREAERLTRGKRWDVMTETWVPVESDGVKSDRVTQGGSHGVTESRSHGVVRMGASGPQGGLFDAVVARGVAALERARAVVASGGLDEARRARIEEAVGVIEAEIGRVTQSRSHEVTKS